MDQLQLSQFHMISIHIRKLKQRLREATVDDADYGSAISKRLGEANRQLCLAIDQPFASDNKKKSLGDKFTELPAGN